MKEIVGSVCDNVNFGVEFVVIVDFWILYYQLLFYYFIFQMPISPILETEPKMSD